MRAPFFLPNENFSHPKTMREIEKYQVELSDVTVLELVIAPDNSGGAARSSLKSLRLSSLAAALLSKREAKANRYGRRVAKWGGTICRIDPAVVPIQHAKCARAFS